MISPVAFDKSYIMSNDVSVKPNIHKKGYRSKKGGNYQILRYDKEMLAYDNYIKMGVYRSLIVNLNSKKMVVFSPNKSISITELKSEEMMNMRAEEFVEGTMVNLFYDTELETWDIATRSTVGGNVKFYRDSEKTFAELFEEARVECGLNIEDNLDQKYCYSFVLQHPENRIVTPFEKASLYLVGVFMCVDGEKDDIEVSGYDFTDTNNIMNLPEELQTVREYLISSTGVKFPDIYNETAHSKENYIEQYASCNTDYKTVGVVFKSMTNPFVRYKCRNPNYEEVRRMRGNQSKGQYTYLELRKSGKMSTYLKLYPEDSKKFGTYREQIHKFTYALYNNYVRCYIKKEKPLREWPQQYRIHMYNIHQKYVSELVTEKRSIRLATVIDYFNEQHPSKQMALLNYNLRSNEKDTVLTNVAKIIKIDENNCEL